jgi:hypothetical protein
MFYIPTYFFTLRCNLSLNGTGLDLSKRTPPHHEDLSRRTNWVPTPAVVMMLNFAIPLTKLLLQYVR